MQTLRKELLSAKNNINNLLVLGPMPVTKKEIERALLDITPTQILFVDGGLVHKKLLPKNLKIKTLSVGDGDSLKKTKSKLDIRLSPIKDFSDLVYVVESLKKSKILWEKVRFLGFSSVKREERIDHLLFNMQAVLQLCTHIQRPIDMDSKFLFLPRGLHKISGRGTFSLMTFKKTMVKMTGKIDYPLENWTAVPMLSTLGLSNIARGAFMLEVKSSVIVYFAGTNMSA